MIPLAFSKTGDKIKVLTIQGGRGLERKLIDMGIYPGIEFNVVNSTGQGQVVISREGNRIGIGHGMALKVYIQPV